MASDFVTDKQNFKTPYIIRYLKKIGGSGGGATTLIKETGFQYPLNYSNLYISVNTKEFFIK